MGGCIGKPGGPASRTVSDGQETHQNHTDHAGTPSPQQNTARRSPGSRSAVLNAALPRPHAATGAADTIPGTSLADLPPEMETLIASHLDAQSGAALRLTKRSFRQVGARCFTGVSIPENNQINRLNQLFLDSPNIRTIRISDPANFGDQELEQLVALCTTHGRKITQLDLSECGSISDDGLAHLRGMPELQQLDLGGCSRLTDAGLAHLRGMSAMQKLNLSRCPMVTDAGLAHLGDMKGMQQLDLSHCWRITDSGLVHLHDMTAMQQLRLGGCWNITNAALVHLQGMTDRSRI